MRVIPIIRKKLQTLIIRRAARKLQILIMRLAKQKFHGITAFIADRADNILSRVHYIFIYTENTDIFLSVEEGRLQPADIKRDTLFQESLFNQSLAFQIRYLAELNFVMHF